MTKEEGESKIHLLPNEDMRFIIFECNLVSSFQASQPVT